MSNQHSASSATSAPKVLVITTHRWPVAARISIALAKIGFQVAAVSPRGSLVRQANMIRSHFVYRRLAGPASIARAIKTWSPEFLVCADDQAISDLHRLHLRASSDPNNGDPALVNLIEKSLGDASSFATSRDKSKLIVYANSVGVRCPDTIIIPNDDKTERDLSAVSYPVVVKADGSWGGLGVRFASNELEARLAMRDVAALLNWPNKFLRLLGGLIRLPAVRQLSRRRRTVSVQKYVIGRPANRAVVCWRGEVLAGLSVEAIETLYEGGPATVVRVIDQPEMTAAAETLVKHLKLSGFIGFDFVLDLEGRAWLIEMNPRVTPICHLSIANCANMIAALYLRMTGTQPIAPRFLIEDKMITLFPQELQRSPQSDYLSSCYNDVPWDEPHLVRASLDMALERGLLSRLRKKLRTLSDRHAHLPLQGSMESTIHSSISTPEGHPVVRERAGDLDLSILIVSFNTREMTLECLRSVIAQTVETNYEIILVDNDSSDGSADAIEAEFPNIRLIRSKENLGFGRANNLAAEEARGHRILLLNPDTVVLDRAIDRLVKFANENPKCRVWGGRTLWRDLSLNWMSCWREMDLWNQFCFAFGLSYLAPNSAIFNSEAYGGWKRNTVRHVDIVTGCLFLIDRDFWNQLGGFDPAFFMYAEEADLCIRARKAGAQPIITPNATIIHYGGASETSRADKLVKVFKGKATIMHRHWSPLMRRSGAVLMLAATLTRWWLYWLAARLKSRPNLDATANEWRSVWMRRSDWISGYPLTFSQQAKLI
jgi:GT2 family glycosyltransferase